MIILLHSTISWTSRWDSFSTRGKQEFTSVWIRWVGTLAQSTTEWYSKREKTNCKKKRPGTLTYSCFYSTRQGRHSWTSNAPILDTDTKRRLDMLVCPSHSTISLFALLLFLDRWPLTVSQQNKMIIVFYVFHWDVSGFVRLFLILTKK